MVGCKEYQNIKVFVLHDTPSPNTAQQIITVHNYKPNKAHAPEKILGKKRLNIIEGNRS